MTRFVLFILSTPLIAGPGGQLAAAHLNGMNYSTLISGLKKQGVEVNRKMLADLAVNDAEGFAQLAQIAKKA